MTIDRGRPLPLEFRLHGFTKQIQFPDFKNPELEFRGKYIFSGLNFQFWEAFLKNGNPELIGVEKSDGELIDSSSFYVNQCLFPVSMILFNAPALSCDMGKFKVGQTCNHDSHSSERVGGEVSNLHQLSAIYSDVSSKMMTSFYLN